VDSWDERWDKACGWDSYKEELFERLGLRHASPNHLISLFICHDGMQPGSYGPLEKRIKCLERERTNNPEVMPSSPMNKCKMQK
jgi:hypothetical protein